MNLLQRPSLVLLNWSSYGLYQVRPYLNSSTVARDRRIRGDDGLLLAGTSSYRGCDCSSGGRPWAWGLANRCEVVLRSRVA